MLLLASCSTKAHIVGEVRNGFGKPLRDVEASISTTAFKDRTRFNGEYSIPSAPSKFSLSFVRSGYSSYSVNQEVYVKPQYLLAAIAMYKRISEHRSTQHCHLGELAEAEQSLEAIHEDVVRFVGHGRGPADRVQFFEESDPI